MFSTFRSLHCSCETIREDLAVCRYMIAVQRLKNYVISALSIRRPVPRSVKGYEDAGVVSRGKFVLVIARHRVGCPMSWKGSNWRELGGANANSFAAIAAIFRCEYQLLLE